MALERKSRAIGTLQPLHGAIKQTDMGRAQIGRQTVSVHSKTVVLASNAYVTSL